MNGEWKVLSVNERPTITRNGRQSVNVVIEIETILGANGTLIIPQQEYDVLDTAELQDRIKAKADQLNRPFMV